MSFGSAVLKLPVKISGEPIAKVIDVYPEPMGREPKMGGYQLMVSADILPGRYRNSFSNPQTYVDNIVFTQPADYKKATVKIFDGGSNSSFVDLPVVQAGAALH